MAFSIRFGNSTNFGQWYLPGTDLGALPLPLPDVPAHPNSLDGATLTALGPDLVVNNGTVELSGLFIATLVSVVGAWNSVKNVRVDGEFSSQLVLNGFVHADADLRADTSGAQLTLLGAKRGNVLTGEGGDTILIGHMTNDPLDTDSTDPAQFRLNTGGGNDSVKIAANLLALDLLANDPTYDQVVGGGTLDDTGRGILVIADLGSGHDTLSGVTEIGDGSGPNALGRTLARIIAFGGDGNDSLQGGDAADQLTGDAGNDTLRGEGGADQLLGGLGNDQLVGGAGTDRLSGGQDTGVWFSLTKLFRAGDILDLRDSEAARDTVLYGRGHGVDLIKGFERGEDQVLLTGYSAAQVSQVQTEKGMVLSFAGGGAMLLEGLASVTVSTAAGSDVLIL